MSRIILASSVTMHLSDSVKGKAGLEVQQFTEVDQVEILPCGGFIVTVPNLTDDSTMVDYYYPVGTFTRLKLEHVIAE